MASDVAKMEQFLEGISQLPIPHAQDALVISDNADIYGLVSDIESRLEKAAEIVKANDSQKIARVHDRYIDE